MALTACLPFAAFDDACRLRPVGDAGVQRAPRLLQWSAKATSCAESVEVNGGPVYGVSGAAIDAEPDQMQEVGAVTASNSGVGGRVHELSGIDPLVAAALESSEAPRTLRLLIGPNWDHREFPVRLCDYLADPEGEAACA